MSLSTSSVNEPSFLRKHGPKLVALLFWLALLGGYVIYATQNELGPLDAPRALVHFMAGSLFGPLLFIVVYALRPLVLFSAGLLSVAGGLLFGPVWGVVYTVIGSNLGASLAYVIGAFFGQDLLKSDAKESGRLQRYVGKMRENAFETILTMRFLFLPYDLVNYLAGFLRVRYGAFILATFLGSLPGTLAFVLFGASAEGVLEGTPRLNPWVFAASIVIFITSLGISQLHKRREQAQREA